MSTVLFGCADGGGSSAAAGKDGASAAEGGEPVTIEVAVSGSAQELEIHQQKFDLYTQEHPNVTIKPVDIGTERFQKLMASLVPVRPRILSTSTNGCYSLAYRNVLMPLDPFMGATKRLICPNTPESLLLPLRYEDQLFALPQEVSPYVMYYNKDMFNAAGVELPTDDWTMEGFLRCRQGAAKRGGKGIRLSSSRRMGGPDPKLVQSVRR